ncbi:hypothetical protein ACRS6B_14125 [Nocardia asteroides]
MLKALAVGGPAEDMHDYDDAVPAMHRFAEHLAHAEPTLRRLDAALALRRLLSDDDFDWPDGEPARLRAEYTSLLAQQRWRELVAAQLALADAADPEARRSRAFEVALSCAGRLGMDALPHALARLRVDRHNGYVWQWAMGHAGQDTVEQVVGLAEQLLPLGELSTGPSEALGFGPDFEADMALEIIVWKLRDHPGVGHALLRVALANRVIRCRRGALTVLSAWPPQARPAEARDWIAAAAERETDTKLRQDMLAFSEE